MRKYFITLLFALSSCTVQKKSGNSTSAELLLEVHFQDFFKDDHVGLKLNNCDVFEDITLNSDSSIGLTKVQLQIYKGKKNNCSVHFLNRIVNCSYNDGRNFELSVAINGVNHSYLIDPSKGKYIGFTKKGQDDLYFEQSPRPFQYD